MFGQKVDGAFQGLMRWLTFLVNQVCGEHTVCGRARAFACEIRRNFNALKSVSKFLLQRLKALAGAEKVAFKPQA